MSRVRVSRVRPQLSIRLLLVGLLSGSLVSCLPVPRLRLHGLQPRTISLNVLTRKYHCRGDKTKQSSLSSTSVARHCNAIIMVNSCAPTLLSSGENRVQNYTKAIDAPQPACTRLLVNVTIRAGPVLCSWTIRHHPTCVGTAQESHEVMFRDGEMATPEPAGPSACMERMSHSLMR